MLTQQGATEPTLTVPTRWLLAGLAGLVILLVAGGVGAALAMGWNPGADGGKGVNDSDIVIVLN